MAENNIIGKLLFSQEDITRRAKEIAKEIDRDYEGEELILLGTLKGSVPWFTDILKYTTIDAKIDFITASSYGSSTTSSGIVKITYEPQINMYNKHVLVIEDIIDSGHTLSYVVDYLKRRGAAEVKICTMFDKPERRVIEIEPDYAGTVIPDEFIVGYGLDYDEKYRNLPFVGVLKPEVYNS